MPPMPIQGTTAGQPHLKLFLLGSLGDSFRPTLLVSLLPSGFFRSVQAKNDSIKGVRPLCCDGLMRLTDLWCHPSMLVDRFCFLYF
jgi:hypothetical protein